MNAFEEIERAHALIKRHRRHFLIFAAVGAVALLAIGAALLEYLPLQMTAMMRLG